MIESALCPLCRNSIRATRNYGEGYLKGGRVIMCLGCYVLITSQTEKVCSQYMAFPLICLFGDDK